MTMMMPIRVRDLPSINLISTTAAATTTIKTKSIFHSHFPINKFKPMSTTQTNDNNNQQNETSPSLTGKQNETPPSASPPPPPEKPEPGDCCGSGCVRCVWDVYYEELEEYNKLYKST